MVPVLSSTRFGAADAAPKPLHLEYINDPEAGRADDVDEDKSHELRTVADNTISEKDISDLASKNLDFPDG